METEAPCNTSPAGHDREPYQTLLPLKVEEHGQKPMTKNHDFPPFPCLDQPLTFADLFAGCGGLSLGLSLAGLNGIFAIERDKMAFSTLSANLLESREVPVRQFDWPSWLEKRAWSIDEVLEQHPLELSGLKGTVQVLAGGPPCQGFSFAGKRQEADPRNKLFEKYVEIVEAICPAALVLENVPGMKVAHAKKSWKQLGIQLKPQSYYEKLVERLDKVGYEVLGQIVDSSRFGVPQKRSRLIVIGIRKDLACHLPKGIGRAFELLEEARTRQLQDFGLPERIAAKEAISDLETTGTQLKPCTDSYSPSGFLELAYSAPQTLFQELMHAGCTGEVNSLRLARHKSAVKERFASILADPECTKGIRMNASLRERYGLKKHRIFPMQATVPAPTITTLPDDVLHYSEPRILTVRESARLQTFPDWFQFRGKFTTGGNQRTKECPRYTQVGNAVPPYLARAIGLAIRSVLEEAVTLANQQADREPEEEMIAIA